MRFRPTSLSSRCTGFSFESARYPRRDDSGTSMARGAYQVLMLVAPFLQPESRLHLEALAQGYLAKNSAG